MLVDKVHRKKENNNNSQISLGTMCLNYFEQNQVNQEASKPWILRNLSTQDKATIDKIFWQSEMSLQRRKGASLLFTQGKTIITSFIIDNMPYINFNEVIEWEKIGAKYTYAYAVGNDVFEKNGKSQISILKYSYNEDNFPMVEYGYSLEYSQKQDIKKIKDFQIRDKNKPEDYTFIFPINVLPIEVVPNLFSYLGDAEHIGAMNLISELERQGDWNGPEWDLLKNNVIFSRIGHGNKGAAAWKEEFRKSNVHSMDSVDGVLLDSVSPLPTDKGTLLQLHTNINWLIDKLEKFMFFLRDTTSTGTNKFNAEIMMYNQVSLEMLINKKHLREEYFTRFMKKFALLTNALNLTNINVDKIKVEVQISEMEKIKLDTLKAQAQNLQTSKVKIDNDQNNQQKQTNQEEEKE